MIHFIRLLIIALGIGLGLIQSSHAFEPSFKRYLSGHDIIRVLHQKFPEKMDESNASYVECRELDAGYDSGKTLAKRAALGLSGTVTGEPINPSPTPAFMKWYSKCLNMYLDNEMSKLVDQDGTRERYLGKEFISSRIQFQSTWNTVWSGLMPLEKNLLITHLIHGFIGPGIVEHESDVVSALIISIERNGETRVTDAIKTLVYKICMREEFLTY